MAMGTCALKNCHNAACRHLFGHYLCADCNEELREELVKADIHNPSEYIAAKTNE